MNWNKRLIETVVSDLRYIQNDWHTKIDQENLRRGSTILRRLLVSGDLGKAWRSVGYPKEPCIVAPCLESLLDLPGQAPILLAVAGGGTYEGVTARFPVLCEGPSAGSYPKDEMKLFHLHEIGDSHRFLRGQWVTRSRESDRCGWRRGWWSGVRHFFRFEKCLTPRDLTSERYTLNAVR